MSENQRLFDQAMHNGHSAAWDQQWDQAARYYRQALEEFPVHPQALSNLGLALLELQQYDEALAAYTQAAKASPEDPIPFEKVAQICERLGKLNDAIQASLQAAELYVKQRNADRALENWSRIVRFNPDHLLARSRLAVTYEYLGRKKEAVVEYLAMGSIFQRGGDRAKAEQAVYRAVKVMPENKEAQQAVGILHANQPLPRPARLRGGTGPVLMSQVRQLEAPEKEIDSFPRQDPVDAARQQSLIALADMMFEKTEDIPTDQVPRRGLSAITRGTGGMSTDQSGRAKIMLHLAQAINAQTQGQLDMAAEELSRAVAAGLSYPAAYFDLGFLLCQSKRYEDAIPQLQQAVKHPDYILGARLLLGTAFHELGRFQEAAVEYIEALRMADSMTVPVSQSEELRQLYEPLVEAQLHTTDQKILLDICKRISTQLLRADWREMLIKAREQLPQQTNGATLLPLADILLQSFSSQVVDAISKIRTYGKYGYYRTAMEEAFIALQYAPTYLPLHIQIAELLLNQEQQQAAIDKFMLISQAYNIRGEAVQAARILKRVIQLSPMDLVARGRLIEQLTAQGQIDEAIGEYMELADLYYRLAELDMARKTYMSALRMAQKSTTRQNWSVEILSHMADIDMQRLDWRQAIRVFEQIRTLQPEDRKTRDKVIDLNFRMSQDDAALSEVDSYVTYLEGIGQRMAAIRFLQDLAEAHPEKIDLRKRLAEQYREAKMIPEAIKELDQIGDQLLTEGNRMGAVAVIQTILSFNPPNEAEYQVLLKQLKGE